VNDYVRENSAKLSAGSAPNAFRVVAVPVVFDVYVPAAEILAQMAGESTAHGSLANFVLKKVRLFEVK
jgi:hypothetical protein